MDRWLPWGLVLVACGGAPPAQETTPVEVTQVEAEPTCPSDQAWIEGVCFSAAGSRWWFVTDLPTGGHREFEVVLLPGGRAEIGDQADTTPDNDTWEQHGRVLTITMNERYVVYSTTLTGEDQLRGRGINVRDEKWDFVITRRR